MSKSRFTHRIDTWVSPNSRKQSKRLPQPAAKRSSGVVREALSLYLHQLGALAPGPLETTASNSEE